MYGRCSNTDWELQTTVTVIGASSTLSAGAAGSRIAVRGIAGLVGNVRIGENGIVGGATSVLMGSVYPVMDVEVSQIHMIRTRGMRCDQLPPTPCLSRPRCRHTAILVDQPGP